MNAMDTTTGDISLKVLGALLGVLDRRDPEIIDRMHELLKINASDDALSQIAYESVSALISARSIDR